MKQQKMLGCVRLHADEDHQHKISMFRALRPFNRHGSPHTQKLWQEYEVPPWQRGRIPMVFYNDQCKHDPWFICQGF